MIYIVDFGSQTAHLVARRIRDLGASQKIISPDSILEKIKKERPRGIILSGGPSSVYLKNSPTINKKVFSQKIPILGICYGWQIMAKTLGGEVKKTGKEYGPELIKVEKTQGIFNKIPKKEFSVIVSHGDSVIKLPNNFLKTATTKNVAYTAVENFKDKFYGVQFHPEVQHTHFGEEILRNFLTICQVKLDKEDIDLEKIIQTIKQQIKDTYVIGAVSGGVDSTVAAVLTVKAIGKKFIPIYVDNGLMRDDARESIIKLFNDLNIKPRIIDAKSQTIKMLKGIVDPEEKRKKIGRSYVQIFEKEMEKILKSGKSVKFLMQGTIYSDVIESKGTKNAVVIKSHHNVGGLPKKMKLKLIEPLRNFYKDEVRQLGKKLGLSDDFVFKQPFPGPGYAIRIRGEVTRKRLEAERKADKIVLEELKKADLLKNVFQSFPIMTGARSTAVKGDGRNFGEVVALRIIESKDVMTSNWARLPYDILQKISSRIVNEIEDISRVVYDITTKPPATMEWE